MNKSRNAPTHPDLFTVIYSHEMSYSSKLVSERDFSSGSIICPIQGCIPTFTKAYSSVQIGPENDSTSTSPPHIELNSDLLYVNHSCSPNVAFEVSNGIDGLNQGKWVVRAIKDIRKGDMLTFAYFSTEWDMAQAFNCTCGSARCLGSIRGARYVPIETLKQYFVNAHIMDLKYKQVQAATTAKEVNHKGHADHL